MLTGAAIDTIMRHGFGRDRDEVLDAINAVLGEIYGAVELPESQGGPIAVAFTAGVDTLPKPLDFARSKLLRLSDGTNLRYLPSNTFFARQGGDPSASATPTHYTTYRDKLYVYPTPDQSDTGALLYICQPPVLEDETTEIPLPRRYHRIVVPGAVRLLAGEDDDVEQVKVFSEQWETLFKRLVDDVANTSTDNQDSFDDQLTLGELMQRARLAGFDKLGNGLLQSVANTAVQEVWAQVKGAPYRDARTTVQVERGQAAFNLPADCVRLRSIELPAEGITLRRIDENTRSYYWPADPSRASDTPFTYVVFNNQVQFTSALARGYDAVLTYERSPRRMVSLTDLPDIPEAHQGVVLSAMLVKLAQLNPAGDKRISMFNDSYQQGLAAMRADVLAPANGPLFVMHDHYEDDVSL